MPSLQVLEGFKTQLNEMMDNISKIKGERYAMMLTTLFNIWGLGGLSIHLLGNSKFAEVVVTDAMETLVLLYFPDNGTTSVDQYNKITAGVMADMTMLVNKITEFEKVMEQK